MKKVLLGLCCFWILTSESCYDENVQNISAKQEQAHTEINQRELFAKQPPPNVSWSLERDNLIKRFKLQNDRAIMFYMYVFIEGQSQPVGYYQINKVSSVNSQLTNTMQLVEAYSGGIHTKFPLPSPAEDGSYGENGNAVFGFTSDDIYLETNMKYIISTIPLTFKEPVNKLAIINTDEAKQILEASKKAMK